MTVHTEIQDSQTVTTRASEAMCDDGLLAKVPPTAISDDLVRTARSYVRIIRPAWRCNSETDSDSESSGSASTDTRGRRRFYRRRRRSVSVAHQQRIELEVEGCGGLKALLELELAVKHDHYQHSVSSLSSFYDSDSDESPVLFELEHLEFFRDRPHNQKITPKR